MTRGRKKDFSIPPTRALVQQRDYRARKARHVAELEGRARKAEEENVQLRKDLEATRTSLDIPPTLLDPRVAEASRDLMQNLFLTMDSLARFQHLAFPEDPHNPSPRLPHLPSFISQPRLTSFPSPTPSPLFSFAAARSSSQTEAQSSSATSVSSPSPTPVAAYPSGRKRLYREDSPEPPGSSRITQQQSPPSDNQRRSPSPESGSSDFDHQDFTKEQSIHKSGAQPPSLLAILHTDSGHPPDDDQGDRFR